MSRKVDVPFFGTVLYLKKINSDYNLMYFRIAFLRRAGVREDQNDVKHPHLFSKAIDS